MAFINRKNIFILQIIATFFAMLNLSNIKIDYIADFMPLFDVMIIYYFAVLRSEIFGIWFLFLLGIIADSIGGFPLGITSLSYIISVKFFVALNKRTAIQDSFYQILWQFVAFAFLILILKWLMISLYDFKLYSIINPLIHLAITSVFYIFMHKVLYYLDKKLLDSD
jgi:rod shape-determining protein MreD